MDAFWLVGGRLIDWGPAPAEPRDLVARTAAALARGGRAGELGAHVPPQEIDEVRIVATYLASHPETPQLSLEPAPAPEALGAFVAEAAALSARTAARPPLPEPTARPR